MYLRDRRYICSMKDQQHPSFQSYYADEHSHCFGCGRANIDGLHVESHWADEDAGVAEAYFTPPPHYTGGFPGFVYGGLIAALFDCHGNGTASAAGYRFHGRSMGTSPSLRYVTASLQVNYRRPTPMGPPLRVIATVGEVTARKVCLDLRLEVDGIVTADGSIVCVLLPL